MPIIDDLSIEISSNSNNADKALNKLVGTIDKISASLNGVNFNNFSQGVKNIASAMQGLQNIKMPDYKRLANGISQIGSINSAQIQQAGVAIKELSGSLKYLDNINISDNSKQIAELAKGIAQLGYKSSTKAIENIPKLATAMSQLMRELSKAPVVSRNLIDMTNALANLARTGASSGRAAKSLGSSLDRYTLSTTRATKVTFSLASALGKLYATYWLLFRGFRKIGDAINIASDLYEVQNVVDVTFGNMASKVEEFAQTSIKQFGMSELTLKQVASQFQAMGSAMSIDKGIIANAQKYLNAQTNGYVELSDSMADVSLTLTKLTADMASFYNVEQSAVAEDLQSIFTGQTKPLRQYGVDLTEVNLKQWAMTQGLNSNIDAMTQAEKTMLRYQYVLAHTGAAQGDFARTSNSWANQVRILRQQFEQLGAVIGKTFIAALKPLINALNNAMSHIIAFAQTVSNALGKIFGWKFEVGGGGVTTDLETGADYADDLAGGMSDAAKSAKKLKSYLLGIDELNVIEPVEDASAGASGGGGTDGASGGGATGGEWIPGESILKEFESEIDTLYELGEYIRDTLIGMMESIDWESVYEKARGFGKGLAEFLNGLLAYDGEGRTLFGTAGKTFANTLNAIIYSALEFAKEFDFYQFGVNIADGINQFFKNFDFSALAQTLNEWVDGLKDAIKGFFDKISWDDVFAGIEDFFSEIELDTVSVLIGAFAWKHGGKALTGSLISNLLKKEIELGIAGKTISIGKTIAISIGVSLVGFDIGKEIGKAINPQDAKIYDDFQWFGNEGFFSTVTEDFQTTLDSLSNMASDFENNPVIAGLTNAIAGPIGAAVLQINAHKEQISNAWNEFKKGASESVQEAKTNFEEFALYWTTLFENLKVAASTKWAEIVTWWNEVLPAWFEEHVMPWFTIEQWQSVFANIKKAFENRWSELVKWLQGTAIVNWWNEDVVPWFDLEKWQEMMSNIQTALENVWDSLVSWWKNTAIYRWYNDNVKPWFEEKNWTFSGIKDGLEKAFNAAVDVIKGIWNSFATWLNDALTFDFEGFTKEFEVLGETYEIGIPSFTVSLGKLPTFYNGGYVPTSYSMFMAGENGVPELLGTVGGRTAVAGGAEITGIREEIRSTGEAETTLLRTAVELLQVIAAKDPNTYLDSRELLSGLNERSLRNGYSF